jgi:hypothetical protein
MRATKRRGTMRLVAEQTFQLIKVCTLCASACHPDTVVAPCGASPACQPSMSTLMLLDKQSESKTSNACYLYH